MASTVKQNDIHRDSSVKPVFGSAGAFAGHKFRNVAISLSHPGVAPDRSQIGWGASSVVVRDAAITPAR